MYDSNNVFAKILRGEINSPKIYEDDYVIAINDINPVAPIHILIIPKGQYVDFADFIANASQDMIVGYYQAIKKIADDKALSDYRVITNKGSGVGQTVFHFHTHLISGKKFLGLI